jgi:hypothetical protein
MSVELTFVFDDRGLNVKGSKKGENEIFKHYKML